MKKTDSWFWKICIQKKGISLVRSKAYRNFFKKHSYIPSKSKVTPFIYEAMEYYTLSYYHMVQ